MNENGGPEAVFMILWTVDQYYQKKKDYHLHMLCNHLPCTVAAEIRVGNLTS